MSRRRATAVAALAAAGLAGGADRACHRRAGDLDLGPDRATWAVRGAHPRIVLRRL